MSAGPCYTGWLAALAIVTVTVAACSPSEGTDSADPPPKVPAWAQETVWYQIFPERFWNGDPSNDPSRESLPDFGNITHGWQITDWTSDWFAREPWEVAMSDDFYSTVRLRRYGGDLQGVIDRLDYLVDLGINGVYFNPLFWARSEHKYDGNLFHHIDPYFGPDPAGDFALMANETADPDTWPITSADSLFFVLLDSAHDRGIRVIIDGVFNHTGRDFFAFDDLRKKQRDSPYKEWYIVSEWDDPSTPQSEFDWKGWWGHKPLPEFADNAAGTDLHAGPKAYVFDATRRWMDPNDDGDPSDGIDGWRLDVVSDVPIGFWWDWNLHVRSINPEAYTVAELWDSSSEQVAAGGFSASMNYLGFAFPTKGFLIDGTMAPTAFAHALEKRRRENPEPVVFAQQNLIDSHDTDRVAAMITNASRGLDYARDDWETWFDYDWGDRNSPGRDPGYLLRPPTAEERRLQRLVALFQMSYVGAPMIYYGTEAGMWSGDDPDDRQPMWWEDQVNAPVAHHPVTGPVPAMAVGFDGEVHAYYRRAIAYRRSHPSLSGGTFRVVAADDTSQTIAFLRELEEESILVILNRSGTEQELRFDPEEVGISPGEGLYPVFASDGDPKISMIDGLIQVTVPAHAGVALIRTGVE